MTDRILEGVRVVDMTQYLAGPTVTRMMAEMGAEIIKIEQPPGGDPSRNYAILHRDNGRSGYFVQQNRGKRSLCLDFDDPKGQQIIGELIEGADVFVENYGPGVLARRGFDWEQLSERNPLLIMASISGFGRDNAWSDRPAFDITAQAVSGMMYMTGAEDGPPMATGSSVADVMSGVHATAAIGFALYSRERTGRGQFIDIAMVDCLFHAHELAVQGPSLTGLRWKPTRHGHRSKVNTPLGSYKGPEGWIAIQAMDAQFPRLAEVMGRPELADDRRYATLNARAANRDALNDMIDEWMASHDTDQEVLDLLDSARVAAAPVLAPFDAIGHPYFESRGAIRKVPDPLLGEVHIPGDPLRFSDYPEPLDLVAPTLGQHNHEILTELGYDAERIADLEQTGALRQRDS
jgi:CoA:oxalate CoA-transferase